MPTAPSPSIYESDFVRGLFDEMSRTYGGVNLISSFGFCVRWRRQCVDQIELGKARRIVDLMSGMSELHRHIAKRCDADSRIDGFDLSPEMCRRAKAILEDRSVSPRITTTDVLTHEFEEASADAVVSSFGLKTFSDEQLATLANQVAHMLAPGGQFAFLEISVPRFALLRWPYLFYLRYVIPVIGRLFMGNPDNYRLLGVYTCGFGSCDKALEHFRAAGLVTSQSRFFFGCATGLFGHKPDPAST